MNCAISVRRLPQAVVLDLSGRLAGGDAETLLRETVARLTAEGDLRILVNLAETVFVDSAGFGALMDCASRLGAGGGSLRIEHARGPVRRVLQITNIDQVIPSFEDETTALESFG